eukprot:gene18841-18238_t
MGKTFHTRVTLPRSCPLLQRLWPSIPIHAAWVTVDRAPPPAAAAGGAAAAGAATAATVRLRGIGIETTASVEELRRALNPAAVWAASHTVTVWLDTRKPKDGSAEYRGPVEGWAAVAAAPGRVRGGARPAGAGGGGRGGGGRKETADAAAAAQQAHAAVANGRRVYSASGDQTVRVWDAETGAEVRRLEGHTGVVKSAAVSPDGRRVYSASSDKTVRVWDAETGAEVRRLEGHTDTVWSAA